MSENSVRLTVEKLVYGGYGLARENNKVFLVRYSAPKEFVEAEILEEKRDYTEAQVKKVIIPSPHRREAPCPYFGSCGGCQLQHLDYETQVSQKNDILRETLSRIGRIANPPLQDPIRSDLEFGYRVRVQFKVKNQKVGFFRLGEKELVEIEECPLAHPRINALIPHLKEVAQRIRELQEIHVFYSPKEDKFLVRFITPIETDRSLLEKVKDDFLPKDVVGVGDYSRLRLILTKRYWIGTEYLFVDAGGFTYRVSGDSFFQVNYSLWDRFIQEVVKGVSFRKAVDLHCGVGFFTLPLAKVGNFIEGSDSNPSAVNDATYNAKVNQVDNAVFVKADAYRHLKSRGGEVLDLVLLDPPRSGLGDKERDLLLQNKPERIIYVSCNPSTLARDLKVFLKGGYTLERVRLIDMFPQTYHIESVSVLRVDR